jgi:hypothetical protein
MGQLDQSRTCPRCGEPMVLALPPGGKGLRKLQCLDCERPDPLKSDARRWLSSELEPPQ